MELKTKLNQLRKKNGLSQMELAEELKVSRQAISRWEVGGAVPSTENFKALSKIYDVPLEYLLHDDGQETEKKEITQGAQGKITDYKRVITVVGLVIISICILVSVLIYSEVKNRADRHPIKEIERSDIETNSEQGFDLEW